MTPLSLALPCVEPLRGAVASEGKVKPVFVAWTLDTGHWLLGALVTRHWSLDLGTGRLLVHLWR